MIFSPPLASGMVGACTMLASLTWSSLFLIVFRSNTNDLPPALTFKSSMRLFWHKVQDRMFLANYFSYTVTAVFYEKMYLWCLITSYFRPENLHLYLPNSFVISSIQTLSLVAHALSENFNTNTHGWFPLTTVVQFSICTGTAHATTRGNSVTKAATTHLACAGTSICPIPC